MKKLLTSVIAAAALVLGFASCSGDLHDSEPTVFTRIIGDMNGDSDAMTKVEGATSSYTFIYDATWGTWGGGDGKMYFKVLTVWDNWATPGFGPDGENAILTVGGEKATGIQGGGTSNFVATGLVNGKEYTITTVSEGTNVYVTLTGYVKPDPVAADLSDINNVTMAQPGAYIEIKGDAWSDSTVGKYFFNKSGDDYVAIIPFNIAAEAVNGWKIDHYQAWGRIGVGDNDNVAAAEKQFNYAGGILNFVDKDPKNIVLPEIVRGKKGVITVTATSTGCTVAVSLY